MVEKVPQPVAQMAGLVESEILQQLVAKIRWGHNILLMEKVKSLPIRHWYMEQTVEQGLCPNTPCATSTSLSASPPTS